MTSTLKGTEVLVICAGILQFMASSNDHVGGMTLQKRGLTWETLIPVKKG